MESLSYFAIASLILGLCWVLLFLKTELRREMILMSLFSIFLLPVWIFAVSTSSGQTRELFSSMTILDFLFLFSLAGIASVVYHIFFGKHYANMPRVKREKREGSMAQWWILRLLFSVLFFVWAAVLLNAIFHLPTGVSLLISAIVLSLYIVTHRWDLLSDSLWSAILTGFIVFMAAFLGSSFMHTTPVMPFIGTDDLLLGVPLDLLLWGASLGLVLGPLYEFIRRKLLK